MAISENTLKLVTASCAAFIVTAGLSRPVGVAAQTPAAAVADSAVAPGHVSPRGAFIRAMLIPGWGHASLGSYTRGGFYFFLEGLTAYTLLRARSRTGEVRNRIRFREGLLRADLATQGVIDPFEVEQGLEADPVIGELRNLQGARERQQEDLLAFGIFLIFLSGIDAYVAGHLADFPAPLEVEGAADNGRVELGLRVTLPR